MADPNNTSATASAPTPNAVAGPSSDQTPASTPAALSSVPENSEVISVLGSLLKSQTGEQMTPERISTLLLSNMQNLVKQGKLTQQQILQLKQFADRHKTPVPSAPQTPTPTPFKAGLDSSNTGTPAPTLTTANPAEFYPPISQTLNTTNPGAVQWSQTRPTLTGGIPSGRVSGTPAQIARAPEETTMLSTDDGRSRRKSTPGDQSMRRTIQDLVSSVDPNVKIEPEVEDLLLSIADEFIDSVSNFACRLAKHRGSDTLEVRDLQLHLERNHNIRIPGFASDETRISLSQSTVAPTAPAATGKKNAQGAQITARSQRLAQVQQAKREGKLM
ncbi:transcription initiation factor TFIID subunit A-domain-containing protein [Crucibulum laeve]|uniref:TBP-associated factor 12 n=1 Tax=Crucibulum laeve TaxID=68775 RepID=A0A5C3MRA2_9AGAR|nr:transcription initiation factor TFIID subunit A-domain-containing protein [Crucibulum laeve]